MADIILPEGDSTLRIIISPIPPEVANLLVTVTDEAGTPQSGMLITVDGLSFSTDYDGRCSFVGLTPGPHSGSCFKEGYEVTSVTLNGVAIPFSNGNF